MAGKRGQLLLVLGGLLLCQVALYWPSLVGRKVLLPLDILCWPGVYMPETPAIDRVVPQDSGLSDLIYVIEPDRRFAVAELRAGRFPSWAPYEYGGAPFIWPKYSPFSLLECATASPVIIAWVQLLASTVAGLGAFCFFRRGLRVRFWAGAFGAWCFPLIGFLVLWQGFPTSGAVLWLPWLLLAVHKVVSRPRPTGLASVGLVTGLTLVSGNLDVAGQVLLVAGLYGGWCFVTRYRHRWFGERARRSLLSLGLGWLLGFFLAGPYLLPLLEYTRTSARLEERRLGKEERPPIGLAALPQVVLPDMYGSQQRGSFPVFPPGQTSLLESSAGAYAGVLATLVLAPLAWCSRRRRWNTLFWVGLGVLGLSWCLDVPGLVQFLRMPGLNLMSHDRLVFASAFAFLSLGTIGLEVLSRQACRWQRWFEVPAFVLLALGGWCLLRAVFPPEPIATQLGQLVASGGQIGRIHDLAGVQQVQAWFLHAYLHAAVLCGLGFGAWLVLRESKIRQRRLAPILGILMVADLLWFAHGRDPQCDWAFYYPRLPILEQLAHAPPGRLLGVKCFPANLAETQGFRDIRGYDAVDPARMVELLDLTSDPNAGVLKLTHAVTQWLVPRYELAPPDGIKLSPILDMLGVRYVLFRGSPSAGLRPFLEDYDYWVLVNRNALPRAFVPRRVETVSDKQERLAKLQAPQFDAREVAYVEEPVAVPQVCRGTVQVVAETPTRVVLSAQMETPGLVVLADRWDKGWHAYLNNRPVRILRANHALRGVVAPAGKSTIEFRYEPTSLRWGLASASGAAAVLICLLGLARRPPRRAGKSPQDRFR